MNYCCSSVLSIFDVIHIILICRLLYFQLGVMTKHLMIGPIGNSEFSFPSVLKVSGKQNSLFLIEPCITSLTLSQIRTSEASILSNKQEVQTQKSLVGLVRSLLLYRLIKCYCTYWLQTSIPTGIITK